MVLRVSRSTYKKTTNFAKQNYEICSRLPLPPPPRSHISIEEFTLLYWIRQRVKQIKLNNMYRIVHGNDPQYLKRDISMVNDQHFFSPEIISVVLPHVKSSGKKTFRYSAGKI